MVKKFNKIKIVKYWTPVGSHNPSWIYLYADFIEKSGESKECYYYV